MVRKNWEYPGGNDDELLADAEKTRLLTIAISKEPSVVSRLEVTGIPPGEMSSSIIMSESTTTTQSRPPTWRMIRHPVRTCYLG